MKELEIHFNDDEKTVIEVKCEDFMYRFEARIFRVIYDDGNIEEYNMRHIIKVKYLNEKAQKQD